MEEKKVTYQRDSIALLASGYKNGEDYTLWIDYDNELWETCDGKMKKIIGMERRKLLKIYGYPVD